MTDPTIREPETEPAWRDAFPVMVQLRTHLDEDAFVEYVREMREDGYRLFAASVNGNVVALAGLSVELNMYDGRHVWVDELVTDADHRSQGYGLELFSFVEDWATERDCELVALFRPPARGRPPLLRGAGRHGAGELRVQTAAGLVPGMGHPCEFAVRRRGGSATVGRRVIATPVARPCSTL